MGMPDTFNLPAGKGAKAILALGCIALAAWLILRYSPVLSHVLLLGFLAILLGAILDAPIGYLNRFMSRWAAFFLVLAAIALFIAGLFLLMVPEWISQADGVARNASRAFDRIQSWWEGMARGSRWGLLLGQDGKPLERLRAEAAHLATRAIPMAFGALSLGLEAIATLMIALFLAWEPMLYKNAFLRLWPRVGEERVSELMGSMAKALRHWAAGTLVSMSFIGVLTGAGLLLLGVEGWLALAGLAFMCEFIPYAGPILSALPAMAVGLAVSPTKALWIGVFYFVLQHVDDHLVQPLVMRKAVRIPPAVLVLWQIGMALGFGFMGLLLATPILAVLLIAVDQVYIRGVLGREGR